MSLTKVQLFPADPLDIDIWAFNHSQEHIFIVNTLNAKFGLNLKYFIVDPFTPADPFGWLFQHQEYHDDFNSILKFNSNDLFNVDFKDKQSRETWSWLHFQEHLAANTALNILT